ncbi:MAG TPA: hypothetical protein VF085_05050 [Solirubrobacterales bacterium]
MWALIGICLVAGIVFGTVKLGERYEGEGKSDYELMEEESGGTHGFPLTTSASKIRFVGLYCLYMAQSKDQLRNCRHRSARDIYNSNGNEFAWLYADGVIAYCASNAGPFCGSDNRRVVRERIDAFAKKQPQAG